MATNTKDLKKYSNVIAECDDRIREIDALLKDLEAEKISTVKKKNSNLWQLQDLIDTL